MAGQCRQPTRPLLGPSGAKPRQNPWRMQDIDSLCQPGRLTPSVDPAILWVAPAIRMQRSKRRLDGLLCGPAYHRLGPAGSPSTLLSRHLLGLSRCSWLLENGKERAPVSWSGELRYCRCEVVFTSSPGPLFELSSRGAGSTLPSFFLCHRLAGRSFIRFSPLL